MSIIKTTIKSCNKKYNKLSNLNKEDFLNDFKMFLKVHRPTMRNINKFGKDYNVSMSKVVYFYGGLCNMLKEIGYEKPRSNKYTKEEVSINKAKLRYDFYIPSKNTIIEFNGIQHYEYTKYFHKSVERYEYQKFKDKIKQKYAESLNIKYVIIKYSDIHKIPEILNKEL